MDQEPKKILLVADYGKNDLAFKEVQQRLYELSGKAGQHIHVDIASVEAFNTAQTAAVVAQAAEDGNYDVIYHNTAPRRDIEKARTDNDGEKLAFAKYKSPNGKEVSIIGVNSGDANNVNTFSLLPAGNVPDGIFIVKSESSGSQFRSRDVFPQHVIAAATGEVQLEKTPFLPPKPPKPKNLKNSDKAKPENVEYLEYLDKVERARLYAKKTLDNAYSGQHSRHGDASHAYVTVISPRSHIDELVGDVAKHTGGKAEVDALPLKKSNGNNWIEAGFAAAQLALGSRQGNKRTIIALPYRGETLDNAERLYEAKLDNGATIISRDISTLAFAREHIVKDGLKEYRQEGRKVTAGDDGSIVISGKATLISRDTIDKKAQLPAEITPAYTDGYGNIKLGIRYKELLSRLGIGNGDGKKPIGRGERAIAEIKTGNNKSVEAIIAQGSFAVDNGRLALSRGSSGEPDNYAEIFLRGGNASQELGQPSIGDGIKINLKEIQSNLPPGSVVNPNGLKVTKPKSKSFILGSN